MKVLFSGRPAILSKIPPGSVVMWSPGDDKCCYGIKLAEHASVSFQGGYIENILMLAPDSRFAISQMISLDARVPLVTLPDAFIVPVIGDATFRVSQHELSKPGDLEVWEEGIFMRGSFPNGSRENPLIKLDSGTIHARGEAPARGLLSFPAIIRHWRLMRETGGNGEWEILSEKTAAPILSPT